MQTDTQKPSTLFSTIALSMLAGLACFILASLLSSNPKPKEQLLNAESIAEYVVEQMPESHLRNNLMIVMGSEYSGDSAELNELLRAYAEMKLKQMKNQL